MRCGLQKITKGTKSRTATVGSSFPLLSSVQTPTPKPRTLQTTTDYADNTDGFEPEFIRASPGLIRGKKIPGFRFACGAVIDPRNSIRFTEDNEGNEESHDDCRLFMFLVTFCSNSESEN